MKLKFKLNIGNYQNVEIETNDNETVIECYEEVLTFLMHWSEITNNGEKARDLMNKWVWRAKEENIDPTPF